MRRIAFDRPLPPQQPVPGRRAAVLAASLGIFATTVSLLGSWIPSLWGDEAASTTSAQRSIPSLFHMLGHVDAVHGAYYLGLHAWVAVFGASPFSLRFPSAVAVGLTVAAVVLLVLRLSTLRMAIVAGILCAILPRMTYVGEEARSFAFSAAIVAWLTLLLIELIRRDGRSRGLWISYAALLMLGIYIFLYVVLFAAVHLVILYLSGLSPAIRRSFYRSWTMATGAAIVLAAPVIIAALFQRGQIAYLQTTPQLGFLTLTVSVWFWQPWFAIVSWFLIVVVAAVAVLRFIQGRRKPVVERRTAGGLPSLELVAATWLLVPSLLLIGSQLVLYDFTARYLAFCTPAAAILMALGLDALSMRRRLLLTVGLLAVVALVVPVYLSQRQPYSKNNSDWANISAALAQNAKKGDAVVFDESVRPSRHPRLALHTYPAGFAGLRDVTLKLPYQQNNTWYDVPYTVKQALALGRFDSVTRVWLIEYSHSGKPDTYGLSDLQGAGFRVVRRIDEHSSVIYELIR